jgi:hypothetical protein
VYPPRKDVYASLSNVAPAVVPGQTYTLIPSVASVSSSGDDAYGAMPQRSVLGANYTLVPDNVSEYDNGNIDVAAKPVPIYESARY